MLDTRAVSKQRNILMGIAIISIILFHYGAIYNYYDIKNNPVSIALYSIIGPFGVDLFAFLSGISIFYSLKKNTVKQFFVNRAVRIVPTYIIIGGIFWLIKDVLVLNTGWGQFLYDFSLLSFWGRGENRFWYVAFILAMYLISPFVCKLMDKGRANQFIGGSIVTVLLITILLYYGAHSIYENIEIAL